MMYLSAIHKNDVDSTVNKEYNENNEFFKAIFEEMESSLRTARELREFGIYTEENEENTNNVFTTGIKMIGQRILDIIRRMQQFISDAITRIKAGIWEAKNEEQQLRELARRYPDRIDEIKVAVSRDELNFASYKDLTEFYASSEKILDDIQKGRLDPKSARGRWESVKTKIENSHGFLVALGAGVSIAVSASMLVVNYQKIIAAREEQKKNMPDCNRGAEHFSSRIKVMVNALNDVQHNSKDVARNSSMETAQLLQEMVTYANMITCNTFGRIDKTLKDLLVRCAGDGDTISKITNMKGKLKELGYYNTMDTGSRRN